MIGDDEAELRGKCVPKQELGHEEIGGENLDYASQTALDSSKGHYGQME
jgi:hypothetical protein